MQYVSTVGPKMHDLNLSHYARFVPCFTLHAPFVLCLIMNQLSPVAPIVLYCRKHAVLQFTITTKHLLFLSCMQGTRLNITDHLVIRQWEVLHTPKSLHVCALNHNGRGGKHFFSSALQIVFVINRTQTSVLKMWRDWRLRKSKNKMRTYMRQCNIGTQIRGN